MNLQECYTKLNGNYMEAKTRLLNDKLVDRFVQKFLSDPSMTQLKDCLANNDHTGAFQAVHTLKGVAANLAFTQLYEDAAALTEQLRDGSSCPDEALISRVMSSYQLTVQTIEEYTRSN